MPDVAIVDRAIDAAPKDYKLPAGQEIRLRAVKASFDGSGAGGAFYPTLQLIAPDGTVMWSAETDSTVAAGASADVSWFPGVKPAAGAAPASTGLSWALMTYSSSSFADSGYNTVNLNPAAGSFTTNDSTLFSVGTVGSDNGIKAADAGAYRVALTAYVQVFSAPAAGSFAQVFIGVSSGSLNQINNALFDSFIDYDGLGDYQANPTLEILSVVQSPSGPPPSTFTMAAGQNSGVTGSIHAYLTVIQISTAPQV